ncbi:MAG: hypothetical protein MJ016_05710 [Victivallaceae bacterium]|nr:hypothetical protein [Victivallaceae bacterium]
MATTAELAATTPRYARDGYDFIVRAVNFTAEKFSRRRHVSARELLGGVRELAESEFGAVFPLVLREWGIATAHDVGFLVYRMIGAGLLCASDEDSPEDFEIDFEFITPRRDFPQETIKIL